MSSDHAPAVDLVRALREAFDESFARVPDAGAAASADLLAISAGGDNLVLRLAELSGLFADKTVIGLPSPVPALLGIAGLRGTILPVYDLGLLLGKSKAAAPRWLVVAAAAPVGFAFERFDGFVRARPDAVVPHTGLDAGGRHIREILHADIVRPIVHLPSILETLANGAGAGNRT
jgi:chemotaxis signal transduction protein